ncbi:hypothetical protein S40285_00064 [Stachybotrys chlorohalonatus IBT 40285]|uniref:Uncharacterized protein n=1 Tax=Stachybotrys chlorohalonatus (strain IBT 40285) TaxID=1283841 RepID=A0A084QYS6_STAC4|nr:hypothetical protein S40285_00064 [Stachybotrys chlorohalonata IBT 40285]
MCGSETTTKPRGGALAALWPPRDTLTPLAALRGDLAFYTPGNPGSTLATHVRLMQAEGSNTLSQNLHVTIHQYGDMTKSALDCGVFCKIPIPSAHATRNGDFTDVPLNLPLSLQVDAQGIMGRRVTVSSCDRGQPPTLVAEGIVGFNYLA